MDLMEVSKTMKIKDKTVVEEISKDSFKDLHTLDGMYTCDLFIKCGKEIFSAHQIILASASKFLHEAILTTNPGKISVLILPDIEPKTMKQIIFYIYHGEITLYKEEDLYKFIEGCRLLGIQEPHLEISNEIQPKMEVDENFVDLTSDDELGESSQSYLTKILNEARYRCRKIQNSRETFREIDLSALTKEQTEMAFEKAKNCVLFVYMSSSRRPEGDLEKIIQEIKLNYEGSTLKNAFHKCGFCGLMINLPLDKDRLGWRNSSLRNHLKTHHGVQNLNGQS